MNVCSDGLAVGGDPRAAAYSAARAARGGLDGRRVDLGAVFVTGCGPEDAAAALAAAHDALDSRTTLGCTAAGVVADGRAVVGEPAVAVWAASLPGARVRSYHLEVMRTPDSWAVVGMPARQDDDVTGLLLADPWSFPAEGFVGASRAAARPLPLVGGMAHGVRGPASTRLMLNGRMHDRGAVGVVLGGVGTRTTVSPGHRPFGPPMTVTEADGRHLRRVAGVRAVDRMRALVGELGPADQALASHGVMLAVAVDEHLDEQEADTTVVRTVLATDDATGSIELPEPVEVGSTVRFCLVDPVAASSAFVASLDSLPADTAGALLMGGADRFATSPDVLASDVSALRTALDGRGAAGMLSVGEIGPVRGGNHVHGLSTTLLTLSG